MAGGQQALSATTLPLGQRVWRADGMDDRSSSRPAGAFKLGLFKRRTSVSANALWVLLAKAGVGTAGCRGAAAVPFFNEP